MLASSVADDDDPQSRTVEAVRAEMQRKIDEMARERDEALKKAAEAQSDTEKAHLKVFEASLRGMSGTGSESSVGGDASRRCTPFPILDEELLARWPEPEPGAVQSAWSALSMQLPHSVSVAAGATKGSFELRYVHPPVRDTLLAAMLGTCSLRLWTGVVAADSNSQNEMKADFSFTHIRDRLPSLLGTALLVEVKPPGELEDAITQALNYARHRMRELFTAALLRGDVPLHELEVFAVATDGVEMVVLRVRSGAPEPGGSFEDAVPCSAYKSPRLALLPGWDFVAATGDLPQAPSVGFVALARLLCSDADTLISTATPLTTVVADLSAEVAVKAEAAVQLHLGVRLGCGGSSDAYAVSASSAAAQAGAVLKLARGATESAVTLFAAEERALRTLAGAPGVPCLVRAGSRSGWPRSGSMGAADVRWPLLLTSPLGVPLDVELAGRLGAACAAGTPPEPVRRALADQVLSGVHAALRAAHGAGLVHCDVRPANCVIASGAPLLVDWGLSRVTDAEVKGCGDVLFALDAVFQQNSCKARAWQDLASAALLWVAIVHGPGASCNAPWRVRSSDARTLAKRREWLHDTAHDDAALHAVLKRLACAAKETRTVPTAADYEWLPC